MRALVAATLALAPLAAQHLTWVEGPTPTRLALRTVPEASAGSQPATVLANLELLPIEITGRTLQQELDAARSRRIERSGLVSVELPQGGRVLAYRRDGGQRYGYLLVRADGRAIPLLELPGIAGATPFADRIGVSPDGGHAVAVDAAERTLFVLRLDGASFASTGTPARSITLGVEIEVESVMPGRTHVFFATDDERMRHCAFADGSTPEDCSPPAIAGARMKSELAMSGDGRMVAFLYGVQPSFSIWLATESGPPVRVNAPAAKYEEPGYLPETTGGPRMLLNDDGTRLLYTDASLRDELYLHDTTGATLTTHVTGDHNFEPYIGIGIFPTFTARTVMIAAIGDPDRFDVYAAATGDLPVANLTRTGTVTRPYYPGSLVPRMVHVTGGGAVLVADQQGTELRLLRNDPGTGTTTPLGSRLDRLPRLGATLGARPDLIVASSAGDAVLEGDGGTPILTAPAGVRIDQVVLLDGDWRVLAVSGGGVSAIVFRAPDGTLTALPTVQGAQRIAVSDAGSLVVDGAQLVQVNPVFGAATVQASGPVRRVLSGNAF